MARKPLKVEELKIPMLTYHWKPGATSLQQAEDTIISHTIQELEYNRTVAAQVLGISIRTLRTKLAKLRASGIKVDR